MGAVGTMAEFKMALSPQEAACYEMLIEAAEAGLPCPVNIDIEIALGYDSCSMGALTILRLERRGLIRVKRYQRFREVQIVETGKWTAKHPSMHTDRPHVPRGAGSRACHTDRKLFRKGRL